MSADGSVGWSDEFKTPEPYWSQHEQPPDRSRRGFVLLVPDGLRRPAGASGLRANLRNLPEACFRPRRSLPIAVSDRFKPEALRKCLQATTRNSLRVIYSEEFDRFNNVVKPDKPKRGRPKRASPETPQTDRAYEEIVKARSEGRKLPPKKAFAKAIGISHMAVEKAWDRVHKEQEHTASVKENEDELLAAAQFSKRANSELRMLSASTRRASTKNTSSVAAKMSVVTSPQPTTPPAQRTSGCARRTSIWSACSVKRLCLHLRNSTSYGQPYIQIRFCVSSTPKRTPKR